MKYQLIMLPNPIVVSDEELTLGDTLKDCFYFFKGKVIKREYSHHKEGKKIIAGIPELPTIDFSALSEEDCKKIGWVDVENLANEKFPDESTAGWKDSFSPRERRGFITGFKAAQSLNEKNFSEEDLIKAIELACEEGMLIQRTLNDKVKLPFNRIIEYRKNYIQSLSQPKVFDVIANLSDDNKSYIITKII